MTYIMHIQYREIILFLLKHFCNFLWPSHNLLFCVILLLCLYVIIRKYFCIELDILVFVSCGNIFVWFYQGDFLSYLIVDYSSINSFLVIIIWTIKLTLMVDLVFLSISTRFSDRVKKVQIKYLLMLYLKNSALFFYLVKLLSYFFKLKSPKVGVSWLSTKHCIN